MTLWTCLPPQDSPNTPPYTHMLLFLQAIILAGSDINASKLKICRRTGCRGCPRPGVCTRGCVAPTPHSDAQWRMQESPTQARRTDVLEAEWVSCWLSAFIPSLSFMQVHVRCHTLPLSVAGDAAYRRGCKTYSVNSIGVWDGGRLAIEQKSPLFSLSDSREEWNPCGTGCAFLRILLKINWRYCLQGDHWWVH